MVSRQWGLITHEGPPRVLTHRQREVEALLARDAMARGYALQLEKFEHQAVLGGTFNRLGTYGEQAAPLAFLGPVFAARKLWQALESALNNPQVLLKAGIMADRVGKRLSHQA